MNVNTEKHDILARAELREVPFSVPEGYFAEFQKKALADTAQKKRTADIWTRLRPVMATAAAFIILVCAGSLMLRIAAPEDDFSQEDLLLFSSNYINTICDMDEENRYAEAEITDEDIMEYLIYTGVDTDTIELYK